MDGKDVGSDGWQGEEEGNPVVRGWQSSMWMVEMWVPATSEGKKKVIRGCGDCDLARG